MPQFFEILTLVRTLPRRRLCGENVVRMRELARILARWERMQILFLDTERILQ